MQDLQNQNKWIGIKSLLASLVTSDNWKDCWVNDGLHDKSKQNTLFLNIHSICIRQNAVVESFMNSARESFIDAQDYGWQQGLVSSIVLGACVPLSESSESFLTASIIVYLPHGNYHKYSYTSLIRKSIWTAYSCSE